MQVELRSGESFDSLARRFKKLIQRDGVLAQFCNRRLLGGKPSELRKFKREKALARLRKKEKIRNSFGG
jgi:ribosomal protein S21